MILQKKNILPNFSLLRDRVEKTFFEEKREGGPPYLRKTLRDI